MTALGAIGTMPRIWRSPFRPACSGRSISSRNIYFPAEGSLHPFACSDVIGLEHLRRLCTAGIYKAAIEGGVLVDTRVGVLVLGQDLSAGYSSQDGVHCHLYSAKASCCVSTTRERFA